MAESERRPEPARPVAPQQTPAQQASQAMADSAAEAERLQLDEAGPGHHYLDAAGNKVLADGSPYKGPKKDED